MPYRLGKKAPRIDSRSLKLAKYTAALPAPPPNWDLTGKITNLGIMLNDQLGDCTCAAVGHVIQARTAEAGSQVIIPDSAVLAAYEGACGYVAGDPSTDDGGQELTVLNYWRNTGFGGHMGGPYAVLQKRGGMLGLGSSWKHDVMNAVYYFGSAYIGVSLPDPVTKALDQGDVIPWTGDWTPNPENGHAVCIVAYGQIGVTVITWGQYLEASWQFLDACMDEGYAILAPDIFDVAGKSPEGFALAELQNDLQVVTE